jgi:chemotaxis protein MotB
MAKKEVPEDEGPSQEWLASYADAMTLLLAFFIMMFAFALIDEGKYFDFKVGVIAALGIPDPLTDNTSSILSDGEGFMPTVGLTPISKSQDSSERESELREALQGAGMVTEENAEALRELLEQEFYYAGASEYVDVGIDERGVFIRFDGRVLFPSAQTTLNDEGLVLLATAADVLQIVDNPLEVEGHTDSDPTDGTRWPSNWELSTARASRVVRWMIDPGDLPASRMTAVGLAETKPRATNNTAEGKQQNRRVEIVTRVMQTGFADEGTGSDTGTDSDTGTETGDGAAPADGATTATDGADGSETVGADGEVVVLEPGVGEGAQGGEAGGAGGGDSVDPIGDPIGLTPVADPGAG